MRLSKDVAKRVQNEGFRLLVSEREWNETRVCTADKDPNPWAMLTESESRCGNLLRARAGVLMYFAADEVVPQLLLVVGRLSS